MLLGLLAMFFNGELDEEVYMQPPPYFESARFANHI